MKNSKNQQFAGMALPASIAAEKGLLAAITIENSLLAIAKDIVKPEHFYSPANKIIFETILELDDNGNRIDLITLQDELQKIGKLDAVGGIVYLVSLQENLNGLTMAEQYAKIIFKKAVLRDLIAAGMGIVSSCYNDGGEELDIILERAEKTIFGISKMRAKGDFRQLNILLKQAIQSMADVNMRRRGVTGIATGIPYLDEMTSGFQKGELIILAARPSMGKTAMALSMIRNMIWDKHKVAFASLEMTTNELMLRLLSIEAGIPGYVLKNGTISTEQWVEMTHAVDRIYDFISFVDDTPAQTMVDIRAKARRLKAEGKLDILFVDYLQLINSTKHHESRAQEVSEISRSLKALAKELNIPIVALSQLSRAVDSRVDKRPMLSDLRESGAIEQDADLILFLYRDVVYNPETPNPESAEIIIGKHRSGPIGVIPVTFKKEYTHFC